jgi:hypothetical protein
MAAAKRHQVRRNARSLAFLLASSSLLFLTAKREARCAPNPGIGRGDGLTRARGIRAFAPRGAPTAMRFDGTYAGTFEGIDTQDGETLAVEGTFTLAIMNGSATVTIPGEINFIGSGSVDASGVLHGTYQNSSGRCSGVFDGSISIGPSGYGSGTGTYSCSNGGYAESGSWSVIANAPAPPLPGPAQVIATSLPGPLVEKPNEGGTTTSFTLSNIGGTATTVTLAASGGFFTLDASGFSLNAGASRTVTVTAAAKPAGVYEGSVQPSGTGVPVGLLLPVSLLSASPPAGPVSAQPMTSRIDVSAPAGGAPAGSVGFDNTGTAALSGAVMSDAPWIVPQSGGLITIPPGGSITVGFSIDRSQRPDAAAPEGTVRGSLLLVYLSGSQAATVASAVPEGAPPPTSVTKVSITDTVVPPVVGSSLPALSAGELALFVPGAGHVTGSTGVFLSDVAIVDTANDTSLSDITAYYTAATVASGALNLAGSPQAATRSLGPHGAGSVQKVSVPSLSASESLAVADMTQAWFATTSQVGSLQVRSAGADRLAISADIFNVSNPSGTYGTAIPVFRTDRAISAGQNLMLSGIRQDASARTHSNLYIQETSGAPASVTTEFLAASGSLLGQRIDNVSAFGLLQVLVPFPDGTAAARLTDSVGSAGRILAYATPVDEATGDSWDVVDWGRQYDYDAGGPLLVPVAGTVHGANGTFFHTDLSMTNTGNTAGSGTLIYYDQGGAAKSHAVSLAPGQSLEADDVMTTLFGFSTDSVGSIEWMPNSGRFAITSRTYTTITGRPGTYGTSAPTAALSGTLAVGQTRRIGALEDASDSTVAARTPASFRTNFGLVEAAGGTATVRVSLLDSNGNRLGSKSFSLGPHQLLLLPLGNTILGSSRSQQYGDLHNVQIYFEVLDGTGSAAVFASSVDNGSGDSILRVD